MNSKLLIDHVVQCTWEGDNNILAQNSGRITIQKVMKLIKDGKTDGEENYLFLNDAEKDGEILSNDDDYHNLKKLTLSFESIILRISMSCIERLKDKDDWDSIASEKLVLSKLYAIRYMLSKWIDR